jgi:putative Mg2+ transporter-C (MgtC) family protein
MDREYREKEAGFRTHFLVSLGSALMMIVSQYGFSEILTHDGVSLDPSRIAAQVVSGIGFIGAGTIIFNHQIVRGLTTAASLWATAGIGLTAGAGMSWLALAATILTLVALEGLSLVFRSLGSRRMVVVFSASDRTGVADTLDRIRTDGYMVVSYEVVPQVVGGDGITYRVTMVVKAKPGSDNNQLLALLRENTDIIVERIA